MGIREESIKKNFLWVSRYVLYTQLTAVITARVHMYLYISLNADYVHTVHP